METATQAAAVRAQEVLTSEILDIIRREKGVCSIDARIEMWKLSTPDQTTALTSHMKGKIEITTLNMPIPTSEPDEEQQKATNMTSEVMRALRRCRTRLCGIHEEVFIRHENEKCSFNFLFNDKITRGLSFFVGCPACGCSHA